MIKLLTSLLQDCINTRNIDVGRETHCLILQHDDIDDDGGSVERNTIVGSYLIRLFSLLSPSIGGSYCGYNLLEASIVFAKLQSPNVFAWSGIVSALCENGEPKQAIHLYEEMHRESENNPNHKVRPDGHLYVALLKACSSLEDLHNGKRFHHDIVGSSQESDIFICNTLISMYGRCGALDDALSVFGGLCVKWRDVVSWSAMIAALAQHSLCDEAMALFNEMRNEGIEPNNVSWNAIVYGYVQIEDYFSALALYRDMLESSKKPDNFTYVSVLKACSALAALDQGKLIHADITESDLCSDAYIRSILIDMYAKCGDLDDVHSVFSGESRNRNAVVWTAMMAAHALHSEYGMVLHYFKGMVSEGLMPNDVTFVCLLSACSHIGLVQEGIHHFEAMINVYGVLPMSEHYNSLLDLFGRAGCLEEVHALLEKIPHDLNMTGWTSLLNSSRVYGNSDLGKRCLHQVSHLELRDASCYVLLSNLFSGMAMWDSMAELLEQRKSLNAWKKPGNSCIEVEQRVYKFTLGDEKHPQVDAIYAKLLRLNVKARNEGYFPEVSMVM